MSDHEIARRVGELLALPEAALVESIDALADRFRRMAADDAGDEEWFELAFNVALIAEAIERKQLADPHTRPRTQEQARAFALKSVAPALGFLRGRHVPSFVQALIDQADRDGACR